MSTNAIDIVISHWDTPYFHLFNNSRILHPGGSYMPVNVKHNCAAANKLTSGCPQHQRMLFAIFYCICTNAEETHGNECLVSCIFPVYGHIHPNIVTVFTFVSLKIKLYDINAFYCLTLPLWLIIYVIQGEAWFMAEITWEDPISLPTLDVSGGPWIKKTRASFRRGSVSEGTPPTGSKLHIAKVIPI